MVLAVEYTCGLHAFIAGKELSIILVNRCGSSLINGGYNLRCRHFSVTMIWGRLIGHLYPNSFDAVMSNVDVLLEGSLESLLFSEIEYLIRRALTTMLYSEVHQFMISYVGANNCITCLSAWLHTSNWSSCYPVCTNTADKGFAT